MKWEIGSDIIPTKKIKNSPKYYEDINPIDYLNNLDIPFKDIKFSKLIFMRLVCEFIFSLFDMNSRNPYVMGYDSYHGKPIDCVDQLYLMIKEIFHKLLETDYNLLFK